MLNGVPVFPDGRAVTMTSAEQFGRPVMFYVPGGGVMQLADGLAKRFGRDDYLSWGLHRCQRESRKNSRFRSVFGMPVAAHIMRRACGLSIRDYSRKARGRGGCERESAYAKHSCACRELGSDRRSQS